MGHLDEPGGGNQADLLQICPPGIYLGLQKLFLLGSSLHADIKAMSLLCILRTCMCHTLQHLVRKDCREDQLDSST